jgi:hypothetical protein
MRLLKLIALALLGYVIYELYLGMSEGSNGNGGEPRRGAQQRGGSPRRARAGGEQLTGAGRGMKTQVEEDSGESRSQTVGRGVTND